MYTPYELYIIIAPDTYTHVVQMFLTGEIFAWGETVAHQGKISFWGKIKC